MHEPAMRNPFATHVDFGFLRGLIADNPKAMPCNIDMVFERKGFFLFGEWKRVDEPMSRGQEIMLVNLAKHPHNVVLVITGDTDDGVTVTEIQQITKSGMFIKTGESVEHLKKILNTWYMRADR